MTILERMTELHPVRKSKAQKKHFRQWALGEMAALGYIAQVEQNDKGRQQNIIAGDPEHAQITLCAHYDTPATILLPDLQIPRNYPVYLLYQIALVGGMLLVSFILGAAVGLLTGSGDVMILGFFGAFLALMWLQLCGFANPNNVNDNTSGVAALLETMALVPPDQRDKVAFILFDNMENGRRGSKAYARDHIEMQHTRFVVSLDSVGVGEHFLASASSLAMNMPQYTVFKRVFAEKGTRMTHFFSSFGTRSNSDFRSFKCGVGVMACRQVSGVGFYLGDLHTPRDTEADPENIRELSQCLAEVVAQL